MSQQSVFRGGDARRIEARRQSRSSQHRLRPTPTWRGPEARGNRCGGLRRGLRADIPHGRIRRRLGRRNADPGSCHHWGRCFAGAAKAARAYRDHDLRNDRAAQRCAARHAHATRRHGRERLLPAALTGEGAGGRRAAALPPAGVRLHGIRLGPPGHPRRTEQVRPRGRAGRHCRSPGHDARRRAGHAPAHPRIARVGLAAATTRRHFA